MREYMIPEMITLREAAKRTGLSYDYLRKGCNQGDFIHVKAGQKILINFNKLCDYLNGEQISDKDSRTTGEES